MDWERERLRQGLHDGDPDVLDHLIGMYQHRLFRYLLSLTGNRAAAEDIFQETWLRVLERGRQYRPQWKFEIWLFSIARHLVIDLARRKRVASLDELTDPEVGAAFEPSSSTPSPLDHVQAAEAGARVARKLAQIPGLYREALVLRFQEELSLEEIAIIVKAPLPTVKSRLYRGLDALRKQLEEPAR